MSTNGLYHDIGRRISSYRRLAGLTAEQLASKIPGLTRSGLAKIEAGVRAVLPVELVLDIALALGVPPAVILFPLGEPGATIDLAGENYEVTDLLPWIVGPLGGELEYESSPAAHGSLMLEAARVVVEARVELETRWGDDDSLDPDEEAKRAAVRARERSARKMMAWLRRQLDTNVRTASTLGALGDSQPD